MIHSLADVKSKNIGKDTFVWQFCVILENAVLGENCNINCHVFIENDVVIGDNVTVKPGVYIWDGLRIGDNVFIGPNVTFTNDRTPRSKHYPNQFQETIIKENASIGAGAIVLGGVQIGSYAMIGAGSLVTNNIPDRALVYGSPAIIKGWLNDDGSKMKNYNDYFIDNLGKKWVVIDNKLILKDENTIS